MFGAGTSFSSPHVAGAAAVVQSQLDNATRPDGITQCILRGPDDIGPSTVFGAGRLDVANAATCATARRRRSQIVVR